MSDPKDSGSDSKDLKNKTVKLTMDQALTELENCKRIMGNKDELMRLISDKDAVAVITDLATQLKEANDVLVGQEKGKLISEILPRSNFKLDELSAMDLEDLKNLRKTLDHAMLPKVNSVRFGVQAADISDREKGLTVGDLSVVTAAKRKALGVA